MSDNSGEVMRIEADDLMVKALRDELQLDGERVDRIRGVAYPGWQARNRAQCGGPDTWPAYLMTVQDAVTRRVVLACVPPESRAFIGIHPGSIDFLAIAEQPQV